MPRFHADAFFALVLIFVVSIGVALINLDRKELDDGTDER